MSVLPFRKPHGSAPFRTRRTPDTSTRRVRTTQATKGSTNARQSTRAAFIMATARRAASATSFVISGAKREAPPPAALRRIGISMTLPATSRISANHRRHLRGDRPREPRARVPRSPRPSFDGRQHARQQRIGCARHGKVPELPVNDAGERLQINGMHHRTAAFSEPGGPDGYRSSPCPPKRPAQRRCPDSSCSRSGTARAAHAGGRAGG